MVEKPRLYVSTFINFTLFIKHFMLLLESKKKSAKMKKITLSLAIAIGCFSLPTFAQSGAALHFDGGTDMVNCGNPAALQLTTGTVEVWIKCTAPGSGNRGIVIKNNAYGIFLNNTSGNVRMATYDWSTSSLRTVGSVNLNNGVYQHLAFVFQSGVTNGSQCYINGVATGSAFTYTVNGNGNQLELGDDNLVAGRNYGGFMDEVHIWNTALSGSQIAANYQCARFGNESGLVVCYPFNQGTASGTNTGITTLNDIAGTAQNGTLSTFALTGPTSNWVAPGAVSSGVVVSILSQTNVSCNGNSNGSATLTVSGGTSYSYAWSPSVSTSISATGLAAGSYTCTVTNQCGQTATQVVTITEPNILTNVMSKTDVTCIGGDGTATCTPSGGTGPYSYSWAPSTFQATQTATGLLVGTYTCYVTDANGCTTNGSITVNNACGPTSLTNGYCLINNMNMSQYIYCYAVSGATNYRYRFICAPQGYNQVFQRNSTATNFLLSNAAGLQYGRTYTVEVAAFVGSQWSLYGSVCSMTMAAFPSTKLNGTACNSTLSTLNQQIYSVAVPGATNWEYKIEHAATSFSVTYQRGNSANDLRMTWVPGITYGKTYTVQVRAYVGGVWGTYGVICNLTTPSTIPAPSIQSVCNTTLAARSTQFYCNAVAGATNYEWNVVNTSLGYNSTMQVTNNSTAWRLSYHVGTLLNTAYVVKVRAYAGGAWGAFGPACTITTGPVQSAFDDDSANREASEEEGTTYSTSDLSEMFLNVFPNPATDNVTITVEGAKTNLVEVFNIVGEKVATLILSNGKADLDITAFPQGVYIIKAEIAEGMITKRLIK